MWTDWGVRDFTHGGARRAASESRGGLVPCALPFCPPISGRLEGASIHTTDGATFKESVHGEFAPISPSRMILVLGAADGGSAYC